MNKTYPAHPLYPPSNPLPPSLCSNAHQPANLDNLRPLRPFVFPCAAMAERRSKKSNIIFVRESDSTLKGMNVAKESRAMFESDSPTLNNSYASHPTTPPGSLPQHHLTTLHRTMGSVSRSSCARPSPYRPLSKKLRINERAALGSDVGRNGRRRNGMSSAARGFS